jgi:hypothetical protein
MNVGVQFLFCGEMRLSSICFVTLCFLLQTITYSHSMRNKPKPIALIRTSTSQVFPISKNQVFQREHISYNAGLSWFLPLCTQSFVYCRKSIRRMPFQNQNYDFQYPLLLWKRRQHISPKRWSPCNKVRSVTSQELGTRPYKVSVNGSTT